MKNKNTYSLLVQSQENGRSIFEGAIYSLVILCVAFTGWQFASTSVVTPGMNRPQNDPSKAVEMIAKLPANPAPAVASNS